MAHAEKRYSKKDKAWYWRVKYKLPNGRYGSASRDDFGNRFRTEKLAESYGHAMETDVARKVFFNPRDGKITVAEWSKLWLDMIDVGPLSEKEYRLRIKNQILPQWGPVAIRDLSPTAIAIWRKRISGEVSKNYVDAIISTFRTMLDDAVAEKIRGDNPVASRKSGRRGRYRPKPKQEDKVIATPRQALLAARNALEMHGLNEYALVLTSAYTGLRIGEVAGLHRDQLALKDKGQGARIHAIQQSQYVNGEFTEIEPKYDSGRGLIVPPFLAQLLRDLVGFRPGSEWVFTAPKGGRLLRSGDWYADTWGVFIDGRAPLPVRRGAKARTGFRPVLGIEGMVPHGLRHSHKVWLDGGRHPRVAVEARMGHELPGVEGTYSHVTLQMELDISAHLQELWEDSLRVRPEVREYGQFPPPRPPRKRSPRNLPKDHRGS